MIETCFIEAVLIITPEKIGDERGYFSETYSKRTLAEASFTREFVQDNQSLSGKSGVIRGLHFQKPPFAQDKLVRVLRGSVLDVAVDIRKASPTFGQYFATELSSANHRQLLVPAGFAHGFCTLEPDTLMAYKVSDYYAPDHDMGIRWDDPDLAIDWPLDKRPVLSEKDRKLPFFSEIISPF